MSYDAEWVAIGDGQEAYALMGNATEIDGIGGVVSFPSRIAAVKRVSWEAPDHDYRGHDLFCKHLVARLLDEFFVKQGEYSREHIPIPLGSFNGGRISGYYYVYAEGSEGFPLEIMDDEYRQVPVHINEWFPFVERFCSFGFGVNSDIADPIDGRTGKNIVFSSWDVGELYRTCCLPSEWKRIDLGEVSCPFRYEKFVEEMARRESELTDKMEYRLALLAAKYYHLKDHMPDAEQGELFDMILESRKRQAQVKL